MVENRRDPVNEKSGQEQAGKQTNPVQNNVGWLRPTGPETANSTLGELIDPRQYIGVVLQYWWLILLVLILGAGLAATYSVMATPLYRATCRYEVFRERRLQLTEEYGPRYSGPSIEEELSRQIVIMRSGSLHQRVMDRLSPEWERRLTEEDLQPRVDISRLREAATMVDIRVDSVNREYSVAYLEEMLDSYSELRREEILASTDRAVASLRREQDAIGRELEAAQEALTQFQRQHNLTYTQTRTWYDERFLANLVQRENALRMEQIVLDSQFGFLQDADVATIQDALLLTAETREAARDLSAFINPTGGDLEGGEFAMARPRPDSSASDLQRLQWGEETDWQQVQARLERLQAEYEDQLSIYQPEHPIMIVLEKEIDSARRDLSLAGEIALKRLAARRSAIDIQLSAVRSAAQAWRRELDLTTEQRAEHAALRAKVGHLSTLYDRVYTRILDGSVVDVDALFSRLVEPVRGFQEPVWPATTMIMALSIIAALGIGVGLAFLLDHFDTRFLDALAIEERLHIPYISGTPDWNRIVKSFNPNHAGLLVSREQSDISTETYRAMRAGVEYVIGEDRPYVLLVTSGEDGEGKTMTTVNLASLFAWSGKRVLLVDCDLRRGSCHPVFGASRDPGMCDYFIGAVADWRQLIQPTGDENFDFIASGSYRHEVPEMLSGARLENLMQEWRKEYDLVLMDSAPAGRVVDTSFLGKATDGTLLVVRHGKASFGSVRHALHRLLGSNVIGFCLNGIQLGQRKYSYYNRYGRYYYGRYSHPYGQYYGRGAEDKQEKASAAATAAVSGEEQSE